MNLQSYFEHLLSILEIEKKEDEQQHLALVKMTTLNDRKQSGITWAPLRIIETGYGMGDYPFMIVERTQMKGVPHFFSGGKMVEILNKENEEEVIKGTIHFVNHDQMKINFTIDDLPHWVETSSLILNLCFDEASYKEMFYTLKQFLKPDFTSILAEKIIGLRGLDRLLPISKFEIPTLNHSQQEAVFNSLASPDVSIIHGPPGTGKTTTLVQFIKQLSKSEKQILVCAPSNAAVDFLTEKLSDEGLSVLRLGNISRVDDKVLAKTLDLQVKNHPRSKDIGQARKQANEYRQMAMKYKRNFGKEERMQRNLLLKEAKDIMNDSMKIEDFIVSDVIEKSQIILTTLVGANARHLKNVSFKTAVIDEAAQGLEPATWIPILKAEKIVLAGDPQQLPPTVKSEAAAKAGLSVTLLEKIISKVENTTLLDTQYRMHEDIMAFSSKRFYEGKLKADETVASRTLEVENENPLCFIDTAGSGYEEEPGETKSRLNKGEAEFLKLHVDGLKEKIDLNDVSIGIISPYKAQVEYLTELFTEEKELDLQIQTVDSFQGQEKDVIYISLTRSNEQAEIGFLKDYRRMNVAMTRARKKLYIIGDSTTLCKDDFYNELMDYAQSIDSYKTVWDYLY